MGQAASSPYGGLPHMAVFLPRVAGLFVVTSESVELSNGTLY